MRHYFFEQFVRNEMKLDLLSRRQHRVVYLVPLIVLDGLTWDFLIQTPVKVEFILIRRQIYSSSPGMSRRNHVIVMEQSWLAQQFVDKFSGLVLPKDQTFCVHGTNYQHTLAQFVQNSTVAKVIQWFNTASSCVVRYVFSLSLSLSLFVVFDSVPFFFFLSVLSVC